MLGVTLVFVQRVAEELRESHPQTPQSAHSLWPRSRSDTTYLNPNCLSSALQLDWTFLEGRSCILTFFPAPQESPAQH